MRHHRKQNRIAAELGKHDHETASVPHSLDGRASRNLSPEKIEGGLMLDQIALIQSLTLPAGAITGQRIVLDGTQGNIRIYDAANHLVVLIDPVGFIELYSTTTGNLIATMDDQGFTSYAAATTGLRTARLQQSGLFIYDVNGDISGVWDDTGIGLQVVPADLFFRHKIKLDGVTEWGSGALARDVNLYRAAANVLKTDDTFNAVIDSQVNGISLPRGVVDFAQNAVVGGVVLSAVAGTYTTIVTGNAIALKSGRRYRITLSGGDFLNITGTGFATGNSWDQKAQVDIGAGFINLPLSGRAVMARSQVAAASAYPIPVYVGYYVPGSDVTATFRWQAELLAGANTLVSTMTTNAGASPLTLEVEDVGV
jgi:hypothetical protein